jgi:hypothetical protein
MAKTHNADIATPRKAPKEVAAHDVQKERVTVAAYQRSKTRGFDPSRQGKDCAEGRQEVASAPEKDVPDIGNTMSPDKYGSEDKR